MACQEQRWRARARAHALSRELPSHFLISRNFGCRRNARFLFAFLFSEEIGGTRGKRVILEIMRDTITFSPVLSKRANIEIAEIEFDFTPTRIPRVPAEARLRFAVIVRGCARCALHNDNMTYHLHTYHCHLRELLSAISDRKLFLRLRRKKPCP